MQKLLLRLLTVGLFLWQPYLCLNALGDPRQEHYEKGNGIKQFQKGHTEVATKESVELMGILERKSFFPNS